MNLMPLKVYASNQQAIPVDAPPTVDIGIKSLPDLFNFLINLVMGIGVALAVIFLVIGGIQYITSKGDQKAAETARQTLTNAVIGFIIVIGAFAIKTIVLGALAVNGTPGSNTVVGF